MGGGTDAIVTGAPDQSAPEDGIVTGILIKASDKTPVAGAHVILRSDRKYDAESDVEGRFQFKKLPRNPYGYEIWAYQANLITQKTPVTQLQAANTDVAEFAPLHLDMVDGRQAKFIVTSQMTGQPISGAVVRFGYPDRRNVETGHDGTAVIMGLLGQQYDVTIEAEGHARAAPQIDLSHAESVSEYKISLVLGGMVQGVVRDASGQPVPDADVEYRESTGSGYYGDAYRTDGQGHFRNRFLPLNQPIEVSVRKDNYIYEKKNIVLTTSQREIDLPITLARRPKGGSVAGTVTNQSGQPVAGAKVANFGNSANPNITTTTDAQGQFTLDDLVAGLSGFEIVVSAKGFAPQLVSVQPGTTEHPGSLSVKLEQGHAIQGRIVDEQGKPLPQAFVEVRSSGYPPGGLGRAIRTDAAGRFAFDSLPADARFDVMLPAYPLLFNIPLKLDSDDPITVTLESPGAIHGIVMDAESGQPLPQFRVRLGFCRARQPNDPQGTYSSELEQGVTFKSDAGRFAVGPLTNGMPVELTVEAEGYESSVVPRAVAVKADKAEELKISLKRIDITSLFTLSGQLLDYEGKPASAAQLRLIVSRDQPLGINDNNFNWELIKNGQLAGKAYCEQFLSLTTDAQGRFKFQNILPAKYLQLAYWGEGVPRGRSLAFDKTRPAQTDTVTIALPQPAIVRGAIDRSNFPAVGSIQLSRKQEAFDTYEFKVNDDQSTFEFHDLPPGDYSLIVCGIPVRFSKNGQTFFSQSPLAGMQFQLAAGETKEVSFSEPDKPK
jgi:protocatechuate 3,4-dioxygenase beta subunit